jgi:hypothetical protein
MLNRKKRCRSAPCHLSWRAGWKILLDILNAIKDIKMKPPNWRLCIAILTKAYALGHLEKLPIALARENVRLIAAMLLAARHR